MGVAAWCVGKTAAPNAARKCESELQTPETSTSHFSSPCRKHSQSLCSSGECKPVDLSSRRNFDTDSTDISRTSAWRWNTRSEAMDAPSDGVSKKDTRTRANRSGKEVVVPIIFNTMFCKQAHMKQQRESGECLQFDASLVATLAAVFEISDHELLR